MVTFRSIGRLGNYLFEAAAAMSYAKKHGHGFTMPDSRYFPLLFKRSPSEPKIIKEKEMFRFDELPAYPNWHDVILDGYFQNVKYFEHDRQDILDTFCPNWKMREGLVSVHVRRGDYLNLTEKHPPVSKQWIERAMEFFEGYQFMFFSDDIKWCVDEFGNRVDCRFSERNELDDILAIANCEHHINSSSTFSWWGAWLNRNPDKVVVTPARWMTESHSNEWTQSIIPDKWIKLEYVP